MKLKRKNKIIILFVSLISLNLFPIFFIAIPLNFKGSWKYFFGDDFEDLFKIPVAISNDGNYIVTGGPQDKIYFFKSSSSKPIWSYRFNHAIMDVDISADGSYIAVATEIDYKLYLFHSSSSNPLWSSVTGTSLGDVDLSYNGDYIVAAADQLYLFEKSSEIPLWTFVDDSSLNTAKISSDGNWIVASDYNDIFYFGKSSSTPLWSYAHSNTILDYSSDGEFIILGGTDGLILLNSAVESPKTALWTYGPMYITDVGISSDGDEIVAGRSAGAFLFFENKISTPSFTGDTFSRGIVAMSPEGTYFVIGTYSGYL
ncbi:MAG: WD40 repeat domain-containing protein, partial [Candidatus Thorarchaeota archaeon]